MLLNKFIMETMKDFQAKYNDVMSIFDDKDKKKVLETGRPFTREYLIDVLFNIKSICDTMFAKQDISSKENEILEKASDKIVNKCLVKIDEHLKNTLPMFSAEPEDSAVENSTNAVGTLPTFPRVSFSDIMKSAAGQTFANSIAQSTITQHSKEEIDKKSRENNVVIFKLPEIGGTNESDLNDSDKQFVKDLCEIPLGLNNLKIKEVFRLGKQPKKDKVRPVKVVFENSFDKRKFMSNLYLLKDAEQKFKAVSISHDLTDLEREVVKTLLEEATVKNQQDASKNHVWKVRGTPGNMKLVQLRKIV